MSNVATDTDQSLQSDETDDSSFAGLSFPSYWALFWVVFYKRLILYLRYPVNTGVRFLTIILLFAVIFFGGQAVAGPAITDSIDGIIVGFFVWTLAIIAFSGLAWNVTREAQWGTLERLFLSPHGFQTVMITKLSVNVLLSFLWAFPVLLVMMTLTREWLTVDPLTIIPLAVLTLASVSGIGFLFAGLALVYKRIENLFQLVQFAFIGLIAAPVGSYPVLAALPISHGTYLLRQTMEDGVRLWEFSPTSLVIFVGVSIGYFVLGLYALGAAADRAQRDGLLGQY